MLTAILIKSKLPAARGHHTLLGVESARLLSMVCLHCLFRFKQYIHEVFLAKYYSLADRLSQSSADGTPVDLQHLIHCLTLDALCEGALAVNPGALTSRQQVPIAAALDRIQMVSYRQTGGRLWLGWCLQ